MVVNVSDSIQENNMAEASRNGSKDQDIVNELRNLFIGDKLKIKVQYRDERSAIDLERPVNFSSLETYFTQKYRKPLSIYYTTSSRDLLIQIKNQDDLDEIIRLYDKSGSTKRLRLILSQKRDAPEYKIPATNAGIISASITETAFTETTESQASIASASTCSGFYGSVNTKLTEEIANGHTPKPPMAWREGACLGRGAFGSVYVCFDVGTATHLAVKKIYLRNNNNRSLRRKLANFEYEINLFSTLSHPNIVQYKGMQQTADCVNIFMEYMTGGSLKEQINTYGALPPEVARDFTIQILNGLEYLHSLSIVHRDIKSSNILRHADPPRVKIGDFGSAKQLQAICSEQGVDYEGTPHYTAPEVIKDSRKFDPKSDVWSVGITLIEMITTRTPWAELEPGAVVYKIAYEPVKYELPFIVPKTIVAAIEKMLEYLPEKRPSAMECRLGLAMK